MSSKDSNVYQLSTVVADGRMMAEDLQALLRDRGWNRPINLYMVSHITNEETFSFGWHDQMFNKVAVDHDDRERFVLSRGEWGSASPAYQYYVQVC